jgi:4-amino-4-deoxy-L-arabinose transferase-like glycosyltransferase
MEAALILSYCGGVFHFLRWSALADRSARRRHAVAAGLFFVLGFMTKFVAVLFLPLTLGIAALAFRRVRNRLLEDWTIWLGVLALVFALCAPWFAYMHVLFGAGFWQTIFGVHVLERMTSFLDPTHVHPWYFYLQAMWHEFVVQRMEWFMVAGGITLLVQTIRRRWFEGTVVLLWGTLPMAIISAGNSKIYHYAYPFLPPVMLAAGYLVGLVSMVAPAPVRRLLEWVEDLIARHWPGLVRRAGSPGVRRVVSAVTVLAAAIAIGAVALGGLRLEIDGRMIFKSSGVLRPALLIVLLALATRTSARINHLVVALFLFNALPLDAYRGGLDRLPEGRHPIRTAAECLTRVQVDQHATPGMIVDIPEGIWHPLYYYFRRVQPWAPIPGSIDAAIDSTLRDPQTGRPILMSDGIWRQYELAHNMGVAVGGQPSPPMLLFLNTVLLLPGPYSACSSEAPLRSPR